MLQACGEADPPHGAPDPGTCEDDPRADSYVANMVEAGANGHFKVRLVESDPAPPAKGSNAWTLQLLDAQDAPVDGATILVTPFMPDHGHGTSIDAVVAPTGSAGGYVAAPINLSMPGLWEVTLDVESAGTRDKVVLAFCIEG